jgi:hypothetical protein
VFDFEKEDKLTLMEIKNKLKYNRCFVLEVVLSKQESANLRFL